MIPSKQADTVNQALHILSQRNPPAEVAAAVERLQRVVATYAGDDDTFVPVDFTESDLNEAMRVFETAARKEVSGYMEATKSAHQTFRTGMNHAVDQKERVKCRTTLIVEVVVAVAKKLGK